MSTPTPSADPAPLERGLRALHWSTLATLAAVALVIFAREAGVEPPPDRNLTVAAVVIAAATVMLRRFATSPRMGLRLRLGLIIATYLGALALAGLGLFLALERDARQMALGFTLAAGIFCLRPPPQLGIRRAPAPK